MKQYTLLLVNRPIRAALRLLFSVASAAWLLLSAGSTIFAAEPTGNGKTHRVILISVDGMHALDAASYIKAQPTSALAGMASTGVNYSAASSTKPSDSFPAMAGIVTGGTPAV